MKMVTMMVKGSLNNAMMIVITMRVIILINMMIVMKVLNDDHADHDALMIMIMIKTGPRHLVLHSFLPHDD